jgi:hypothetical protein
LTRPYEWARPLLGWLGQLGRKSLLVYVAHLFIEVPLIELLTLLDPTPPWRAIVLPLTAALLIRVATAGEQLEGALATRAPARFPFRAGFRLPASGIMGSAVAGAAALAVIALQVFIGPLPA